MAKFIEVHSTIINIEGISKIDFISDDIYLGLFPKEEGEIVVDFVTFTFARIEMFTGQKIDLEIDLYWLEEEETEEDWLKKNRAYINLSWNKLVNSIGKIEKITGYEY